MGGGPPPVSTIGIILYQFLRSLGRVTTSILYQATQNEYLKTKNRGKNMPRCLNILSKTQGFFLIFASIAYENICHKYNSILFRHITIKSGAARDSTDSDENDQFRFYINPSKWHGPGCRLHLFVTQVAAGSFHRYLGH
jgi:hypothetical protein